MYCDGRLQAVVLATGMAVLGAACTPGSDSPRVAYEEAETEQPLEVPPDLARDGAAAAEELPDLEERGEDLLPQFRNIELQRAGPNSWLEMRGATPEEVWPEIEAFLRAQGLEVRAAHPSLGIIETDWARRFDSPPRGGIAGFFENLFGIGRTDFSDRYQFRLERMRADEGTRVFVSHWVAEDQARGGGGAQQHRGYQWQHLAGDPAVIAEIQQRLLLYIGMREEEAARIVDADAAGEPVRFEAEYDEVEDIGSVVLDTRDRDDAWARLGDSLGQLGAQVVEQDPDRGLYRIDWVPPDAAAQDGDDGGLLALFDGDDDVLEPAPFLVHLREGEDDTGLRVVAAAADADLDTEARGFEGVPTSRVADRALLQQLADHLGGVILPGRTVADAEELPDPETEAEEAEETGGAVGRRGY